MDGHPTVVFRTHGGRRIANANPCQRTLCNRLQGVRPYHQSTASRLLGSVEIIISAAKDLLKTLLHLVGSRAHEEAGGEDDHKQLVPDLDSGAWSKGKERTATPNASNPPRDPVLKMPSMIPPISAVQKSLALSPP